MNGDTMTREATRVLVVDDSPDDASVIGRMLARYHGGPFDVHVATSTRECLKALRGQGADIVILDFNMPEEDGLSFLRRLAHAADLPPVIMVTGQGDERIAAESIRAGAYDYVPKDALSAELLGRTAEDALERFRREEERSQFDEQILLALAEGVEARDAATGGHLQRLSYYAMLLGRDLGLEEHELAALRCGGLLHDIGKLAVQEGILRKAAPLTEEEWEEMRQHTVVGERMCGFFKLAPGVVEIVRHHHERWDGRGYPDELTGKEIPYLARIVSVVDAFDSMRSDRPYQRRLPLHEVARRLRSGAGRQWDPAITRAFLHLIEREALGEEPEGRRADAHAA
jgi:putative two-component system response regulator